jgi:hypothetical protein
VNSIALDCKSHVGVSNPSVCLGGGVVEEVVVVVFSIHLCELVLEENLSVAAKEHELPSLSHARDKGVVNSTLSWHSWDCDDLVGSSCGSWETWEDWGDTKLSSWDPLDSSFVGCSLAVTSCLWFNFNLSIRGDSSFRLSLKSWLAVSLDGDISVLDSAVFGDDQLLAVRDSSVLFLKLPDNFLCATATSATSATSSTSATLSLSFLLFSGCCDLRFGWDLIHHNPLSDVVGLFLEVFHLRNQVGDALPAVGVLRHLSSSPFHDDLSLSHQPLSSLGVSLSRDSAVELGHLAVGGSESGFLLSEALLSRIKSLPLDDRPLLEYVLLFDEFTFLGSKLFLVLRCLSGGSFPSLSESRLFLSDQSEFVLFLSLLDLSLSCLLPDPSSASLRFFSLQLLSHLSQPLGPLIDP